MVRVEYKPHMLCKQGECSCTTVTSSKRLRESLKTKMPFYDPTRNRLWVEGLYFEYIRSIASNEDKRQELAFFQIAICIHFKKVYKEYFGMDGLAILREIIRYFRYQSLKDALKDFVYCLHRFPARRYGFTARESPHTFK